MVLTNSGVPKLQESTLKNLADIYPNSVLWNSHLTRIYETLRTEDSVARSYLHRCVKPYPEERRKSLLHAGLSAYAVLEAQVENFNSSLPESFQQTYGILLNSYRLNSILPINHSIVEALELDKKIDETKKHDNFIDSVEQEIANEDPVFLMYCDSMFRKNEMRHRAGIRDVAFSVYALVHQVFVNRWDSSNSVHELLFEGLKHMDNENLGRYRNPAYDLFSLS